MAGAKPGVHAVQLRPISVPKSLVQGGKFVKWDEGSTMGVPVTLRVDPKGYILYWRDQNKEMDCLDISLIRDTRTGKYARLPKDQKLRESLSIGQQDQVLEDKTLSVCYGTDFVNVEWLNFVCSSSDIAQEWCSELLGYAKNLLALNCGILSSLEKAFTKAMTMVNPDGKAPVKNIIKMVAQNRDDRRRVEKALEAAHIPSGKNDTLDPNKISFEDFLMFYRHLTGRTEVDKVFADTGAKKKPYLTIEQFMNFLNMEQRDPRLNEILYPNVSVKQASELINQFESSKGLSQGQLSPEGFLKFLMSEENGIIPSDQLDLSHDMTQPLAHYFINSSHNTYLTGHQFTSKSSVEMYRQTLLAGCRCVELDCWDGKGADEEPIITHGFTMCTEISFKEVIEAIAESAFKTSEYPVILSFENHCSPKQQAKMAAHCRNVFGDMLLTDVLDGHPLKPNVDLPSPELMKRKIIVKNKKKHFHKADTLPMERKMSRKAGSVGQTLSNASTGAAERGEVPPPPKEEEEDNGSDSDSNSDDEGEVSGLTEEEERRRQRERKEKGTAGSEAEAAMEMSALVNYVQPVHFHSFEISEKRARSYEISSFVETQATTLLKDFPPEFVNYNKRQLSRIYPRGTRVDSSNCMPQVYWNAGCQLVALNFQTLDLAMQLNLGIFEYNNCSGYILKPDFMRRGDRHFDPFAESTVDGIVAGTVTVRVISGQLLTDKRVGTYVEVDMYGLPTDTVRKRFKTKVVPANGINPVYDEDPFVFKKVVLPNLAVIRMAVYEETGKFIGHRVLPVEGLRPGYRHVTLRNDCNQPLMLPTLFVHISVRDYVPDAFADFAAALVNPIAHQEKHAQQLAVLTEDFDYSDDEDDIVDQSAVTHGDEAMMTASSPTPFEGRSDSRKHPSLNKRGNSIQSLPDNEKVNGNPKVNRTGSTHVALSKQESSSSAFSQGSGSTGVGNPVTRMKSTANMENGTMGQSMVTSTRLNDPEMITPVPLEDLKQSKVYLKAEAKRTKDVESLKKKHEKEREFQKEAHALQEDRFLMNQLKARSSLEKSHGKLMKKASKSGSVTEAQHQTNTQMGDLLKEQEIKLIQFRQTQIDEVIKLYEDQYKDELDIHLRHHDAVYDALKVAIEQSHIMHKRKLVEVHDNEVLDLKKRMDAQNREDMKVLAKKHKDRQELSRIKREAQQKHITLAVQERQKMKDILEKRTEELDKNFKDIWQEYEVERQKVPTRLTQEYEVKCRDLQEEMKNKLKTCAESSGNHADAVDNGSGNPGDSVNGHEEITGL